jgi:poly(3-hydroxybutyrate) depolymerase
MNPKLASLFYLFVILGGYSGRLIAQTNLNNQSIVSNALTRTFNIHLPAANPPAEDMSVLIVLHGDGGTGSGIATTTGLNATANTHQFMAVYPNGISNTWNSYADPTGAGNPCWAGAPNDVLFMSDLIDYLHTTYCINRNKVYVTGFSQGGTMAYYLAMALPDKIAALAPVSPGTWWNSDCNGGGDPVSQNYVDTHTNSSVPLLHIHGTADNTTSPPNATWPWPEMLWLQNGGCDPATPTNISYPNTNSNNWFATEHRYLSGGGSCAVSPYKQVVIRVNSAGHVWPNSEPTDFNPNEVIWAFCDQFDLDAFSLCNSNPPVGDPTLQSNIHIDQFGYPTAATKIATITNPLTGYNNNETFIPSTTYRLRRSSDHQTVFTANIAAWNNGNTHDQSGDRAWWFDFSNYQTPGTYYVFDSIQNVRSYDFVISDCVYEEALKISTKTFYYQRCGVDKDAQYSHAGHSDAMACHIGALQDTDCRLYSSPTNATTSRNLSGGWHDAGDYNKYVNFTYAPLVSMLLAYEEQPNVWTDDFDIPESGNGVPDLLDEVKFELDWLLKMQQANGSVLSVVGVENYASASPPSADVVRRLYGPATTSASYTAAAVFALAAIQYNALGMTAYATTLQTAATNAYNWATANANVTFYNENIIAAGEQEVDGYETNARHLAAAVFLYALTNNSTYKSYVEANYTNMHLLQWTFAYVFESTHQDALLYYTNLSGVTASVATAIRNAYSSSIQNYQDHLPAYNNQSDAYRAYLSTDNTTWGSNQHKAQQGNMFQAMNHYGLNAINASKYSQASAGFLHYLHGTNPINICYLSNMGEYGADYSVREIYHGWFVDGSSLWDRVGVSTFGPAPGFMPGGPTYQYGLDACCSGSCSGNSLCNTANVTPPLGQPVLKAYKEFNSGWPANSWVVSETAIYTQADYIRLLSKFTCLPPCVLQPNINGNAVVCSGTAPNSYTTPAVNNATYEWTVTGGTIISGQGTNTIQVQWTNSGSGTIEILVTTP